MKKLGYKRGIVAGLPTCAIGALLFIPAASVCLRALRSFCFGERFLYTLSASEQESIVETVRQTHVHFGLIL
jgi:fucose permease